MSEFTLTHAIAVAEQARRTEPKATRTRCKAMLAEKRVPKAHRDQAERVLMGMGTADLADAVELLAPKAKPAKPAPKAKTTQAQARAAFAEAAKARKGTGVGGSEHTARRQAAFDHRKALFAQGTKITMDEALALFGTARARDMAQMTPAQIEALTASATLTV